MAPSSCEQGLLPRPCLLHQLLSGPGARAPASCFHSESHRLQQPVAQAARPPVTSKCALCWQWPLGLGQQGGCPPLEPSLGKTQTCLIVHLVHGSDLLVPNTVRNCSASDFTFAVTGSSLAVHSTIVNSNHWKYLPYTEPFAICSACPGSVLPSHLEQRQLRFS